jgi:hypothetical protein
MNVVLKYFSQPSFNYLTFFFFPPNPTHQTKIGIANRWETTNSKEPSAAIIMTGQSESSSETDRMLGQNHFAEPNRPHVLTFLLHIPISRPRDWPIFSHDITKPLFFFPFFFFFFRKVLRKRFPHGTNHKLLNWVIDFLGAPLVV